MTNPVAVVRDVHFRRSDEPESRFAYRHVITFCPGCNSSHPFTIEVADDFHGNRAIWNWDGNLEKPTFSPSLLCHHSVHLCEGQHELTACPTYDGGTCERTAHWVGYRCTDGSIIAPKVTEVVPDGAEKILVHDGGHVIDSPYGNCHSFLSEGVWQFLGDSAHYLAGQSVPMVPLPDWLVRE